MGSTSVPALAEVRTAEVIGSLCLATDLAIGLPFEHGLQSTLVAMRLAERLGVDADTATQTYYGCMLFYVGCTTDADVAARMFPPGALLEHFNPVIFGSPLEMTRGIVRALGDPALPQPVRTVQGLARLPAAARGHREHVESMCQVAEMLCTEMGMPPMVVGIVRGYTARWDGRAPPHDLAGEALPLAIRIVHVARDAALQQLIGGTERVVRVVGARAGKAFDPTVVEALLEDPDHALVERSGSVWGDVLDLEPGRLLLRGEEVDRALAALGDFADLVSSYLVGHSVGVARLAAAAAARLGLPPDDVTRTRRAGFVHDLGRVAVSSAVWDKPGPLTADEWEHVRLHAYHAERVLGSSEALAPLGRVAGTHHERLDGSGYHRGATAPMLPLPDRVLAAADAFHTMLEARPHRAALSLAAAAEALGDAAAGGRLDPEVVGVVLAEAGRPVPHVRRPDGLTDREVQVLTLVARGLQTKQAARHLGISPKTADRHLQNAYAKTGISTRAAAALYAMQHGLVGWGELPIPARARDS